MQSVSTSYRNIQEICAIEQEALQSRSLSQRISDVIAEQAGRMWFIALHAIWFGAWVVSNLGAIKNVPVFDPFPYSLLTMIVSLEAIFLSLFILMSQNRSTRHADQRGHLDLQINLLAEHENTKMLQMLQALCEHHGLRVRDAELEQLSARTEPQQVLKELKDNLPDAQ